MKGFQNLFKAVAWWSCMFLQWRFWRAGVAEGFVLVDLLCVHRESFVVLLVRPFVLCFSFAGTRGSIVVRRRLAPIEAVVLQRCPGFGQGKLQIVLLFVLS